MLKAAIPLFQQLNHKLVAIAGGGRRAHQAAGRRTDGLHVSPKSRGPTLRWRINQNKFVGMTSHLKRLGGKWARMHRTVDQGIQING